MNRFFGGASFEVLTAVLWESRTQKLCNSEDVCEVWRTIGAKLQLLNFACTFGIRCCSFTIWLTSAIQHSRLQFLYSNWRFDIVCFTIQHPSLQFYIQVHAIQHPSLRNSTFKFAISLFQLTIWHCLFHNSTSKFTQFNIQVYNSTSKFTQFNIQVYAIQHSTLKYACFQYPTATQSMTVSVGSENYQNSPCVGASKGRSRYPRQ